MNTAYIPPNPTHPERWVETSIAKPDETSVTAVQQQPGVHYGQRKSKSEKRSQEAEEREAKGCARHLPQGLLTGFQHAFAEWKGWFTLTYCIAARFTQTRAGG